jgi:predicted esterase
VRHLISSVLRPAVSMGLMALLVALAGCERDPVEAPAVPAATPAPVAATPATATPAAATAQCGEGWRAVDDTLCLALPERFAEPPSLVIFAPGILAPGVQRSAEEATLLAAARKLGFAVLSGRGKQGLCEWDPKLADQICWPTTRETVDREAPAIVAGWVEAQPRAAEMAGVRFERRYLVGFSNGGYFTAYVVMEGLAALDGAAVVGAGRTAVDESRMPSGHTPLYLAVGGEEAGSTRQDAENLAQVVTRHAWPLTYVVHPQRGHELHEDDLAGAWAAWAR